MADWKTGNPTECGYYLAAWVQPSGYVAVSELWFNSYDKPGRWWASRKYLVDDPPRALWDDIPTVVGWMPKPEAPSVDDTLVQRMRNRFAHKICRARNGEGDCVCGAWLLTPTVET